MRIDDAMVDAYMSMRHHGSIVMSKLEHSYHAIAEQSSQSMDESVSITPHPGKSAS